MLDSFLVRRFAMLPFALCSCVNLLIACCAPAMSETSIGQTQYKVIIADMHAAPEPHAPAPESGDVVAVLKQLIVAMANGDTKAYAALLSDDCTLYDEERGKALSGKAEVASAVQKHFRQSVSGSTADARELIIEHPYVKVSGDMAVVTFKLVRKQGSSSSRQLYTNIFTRDKDSWKKSYDRGNWNLQ